MSQCEERWVQVAGRRCRVLEKGEGRPIGVLPGFGGFPRWSPFLEQLSRQARVIAPSLPGFPGATGHDQLDDQLDWVVATRDLLWAAGLDGSDLVGISAGGALAADFAAIWPKSVRRLVLISPLGLFDVDDPSSDVWAQEKGLDVFPKLVCARPERFVEHTARPHTANPVDWEIESCRAAEAAARFLFPFGDTGLGKRLYAIKQPLLLLRGTADRVIPESYIDRFAAGVRGVVRTASVADAGHLADLDEPALVADLATSFFNDDIEAPR